MNLEHHYTITHRAPLQTLVCKMWNLNFMMLELRLLRTSRRRLDNLPSTLLPITPPAVPLAPGIQSRLWSQIRQKPSQQLIFFLAISLKVDNRKQYSCEVKCTFVLIPIENCPVKGLSGWMPAVTRY